MNRKCKSVIAVFQALFVTVVLSGCFSSWGDKTNYITYLIEHVEDAKSKFEEKQLDVSVVKGEEEEQLLISTENNVQYFYEETMDESSLSQIELDVSCVEYGEKCTGTLTMYRIENDTIKVVIEEEEGMVGVKYCLPKFDEVVPDWGDYLEAELKIEQWISKEEMASLYEEGKRIEQLLIEYYEDNVKE